MDKEIEMMRLETELERARFVTRVHGICRTDCIA
jgi:hypothetical protein